MLNHPTSPLVAFEREPGRSIPESRKTASVAGVHMRPVCGARGSDAIVREASAVWNSIQACWELAGTYDSTTCQSCEAESDDLADWQPFAGEVDSAAAHASAPARSSSISAPARSSIRNTRCS